MQKEILDTCGLEESKHLFAHPNLVREVVCFDEYSLKVGCLKMHTCLY